MLRIFRTSFYFVLATLVLTTCYKDNKPRADKTAYAELVNSYTSGFVSSTSDIKIKLAQPATGITSGSELEPSLISFNPTLKGRIFWEDEQTIVFQPSQKLKSGQEYSAELALHKLIKTPDDKKTFAFSFQCIPQNFDIKMDGLSLYDTEDLSRVKISGVIQTADVAPEDQIEAIISAKQEKNGKIKVSFDHSLGQNKHRFTIEEVARTEKSTPVTISFDGASIEVDKTGSLDFPVPSLSDYSITSVQLVRGNPDYVSIKFSDPILTSQNLRGAVSFSKGNNPRVVVELNELKVYPTSMLNGKVDITVNKMVKNVAGYSLAEDYSTSLTFSSLKPQIKMAANAGTIMPSSEGLIVPFEAVSLDAIDLTIVEILENNMLQYLQQNDFGGGRMWNLKPVARPILRKTISLNATGAVDLGDWNRFTIDLAKYITVNPGAMYQVRLGFRQGYSLYGCVEESDNVEFVDDLEFESTLDWDDTYDDYYYYNWENRDNPCHKAYYTSERFVQKIVFASDMGIIAKAGDNNTLHVFLTNLVSTGYINGATIEVFDYQQQKIGEGKTDAQGKVIVETSGKPYVITARNNDNIGYLKVGDGAALSVSNFNVTGNTVQEGIKGFLYGERGVWRPGDTLHINFMLEDVEGNIPASHPVVLEFFNPTGQLYGRTVQSQAVKNIYSFKLTTKKTDPTGNWRIKAKVGGAEFWKRVKIETVKPNRLKVDLAFDEDVLLASSNDHKAHLKVNWLHGATGKNLKASYEVLLAPVKTKFKGFEQFIFDDPRKSFTTEAKPLFTGKTNEQGEADISFKLTAGKGAPGMLNAIFRGQVFEEGGDFSIDKEVVPYAPYSHFVGLTFPETDRWNRLAAETNHLLQIATLDTDGRPANRNLSVEVYKIRWRWWWDNSYESSSAYSSRYETELVKTSKINSQNGKAGYTLNLDKDWGRYYVKINDLESGHSTGKVFYLTYPGWARTVRGQLGGVSMLDFTLSQEEAVVGDELAISFASSKGAKALISIENGRSVLQDHWVETTEGTTKFNLPISEEMAPNIFINISLLQPHAQSKNDLPIRLYGIQRLSVVNNETVLQPKISMPDELRPGQTFDVRIEEESGKPMTYTIAIVEDGLLDLTQFKTPDAWKTFYAEEALGVKTWDVYDDVMGSYGGQIEQLLAVGGDDEIKGPEEDEANRFKPVVLFKGPFFLDDDKKMTHRFTMPEYIGSVRAMVVAGHNRRYGKAEKTIPVKQPLMLLPTLPRVVGPNELITLPVNVFAMDKSIASAEVILSTSGNLEVVEGEKKMVNFSGSVDQMVYFKLKATAALGKGKVTVSAVSGNLKANSETELMVRAPNPLITQVDETVVSAGSEWQYTYKPVGMKTTNDAVVEISTLPPLNLEQRIKYLIRYPHGCIEQTTSSVFAQLYLADLANISEERKSTIQSNINAAISRLRKFQLSSGAFTYWPGSSQPSYWGTNYAGHFLIEARKSGYLVPEDMINKWQEFQLTEANQWSENEYRDYLVQSYRLYVLSLANKPALGAMNRLKENTSLSTRARWSLASAYATIGQDQAAREIIDGLPFEANDYREMGWTYGSGDRDRAMILETLLKLGMESDAFEQVKYIAGRLGNSNVWMSTQTSAYCLIAVSEYARKFPPGQGVSANLKLANNDFRVDGSKYMNQVTLLEPDKTSPITVKNNGESPLFVRVVRSGVPVEGIETASEQSIRMTISYLAKDGKILDPGKIEQGTDFLAKVRITNPGLRGDYEEIALTQIFPSGWEIINTRLDDTNVYEQDQAEYRDIRDDRVLTYFDLDARRTKEFVVRLNASYRGKYYLPAIMVEAMYDNSIAANTAGRWVEVTEQK